MPLFGIFVQTKTGRIAIRPYTGPKYASAPVGATVPGRPGALKPAAIS